MSKPHALLAGLAGAGLAGGGIEALQWSGRQQVGCGALFPLILGLGGAFFLGRLIIAGGGHAHRRRQPRR